MCYIDNIPIVLLDLTDINIFFMAFYHIITDLFTGTKRPSAETPILQAEEVEQTILAVNRKMAPFQVRKTTSDEPGDLVAEWKIVDAKWYEIFAKAGLKSTFRIYMHFDDVNKEVHAMDREFNVAWKAGVPTLSMRATAFQGQKQSVEFSTAYAFQEEGGMGEVYKYRFSTGEIKKLLHKAVTESGWTYRGVIKL